ncbi:MAG: sugar nucleotide-binding protein [Proteobacteria bacterium]|nr:sugar nucleotide-binding protein [Pseudomonadota bacterium]
MLWPKEMMWPKRLLVVGADGALGRAACAHFSALGATVIGTTRRRNSDHHFLDLTVPASWEILPEVDAVVICAGVTSIVDCAQDPARAMQVNVRGTVGLAWQMAAQGAFVLYLSSNQVFDGSIARRGRDSAPCPVSEYGRNKALAEAGMRHLIDRNTGAVLRLTKVMTPGTAIIQSWRRDLKAGRRIGPFSNLPLAPISVDFALETIETILSDRQSGVFHASSHEDSSYLSLAHVVAEHDGADPGLIRPIEAVPGSIGFDSMPRFSSLDMQVEMSEFDLQPPSAKDVFRSVLAA